MKNLILILLPFLLINCGNNNNLCEKPVFNDIESLLADSTLTLASPLYIRNWKIDNGKVVIFDQTKDDNLLTIFQLPDFKPLYTFGKRGHAQSEFIAPMWLDTKDPNTCGLYDMMTKKMYVYDIMNDTLINKATYSMGSEKHPLKPYTIIQQFTDSLYLYRSDSPDETIIELQNPNNPNTVKNFQSLIKRPAGIPYTTYDYIIHQTNNKVVFAFKYIDRMEFYNKSDSLITPTFVFGDEQGQEKEIDDYDNLKEYYTDITDDGKYIYAVYQSNNTSFIEVWDPEGTPIKKYELDKHIRKIRIDKDSHLLYAFDPNNENNVIFTYPL